MKTALILFISLAVIAVAKVPDDPEKCKAHYCTDKNKDCVD